MEGKMFEASLMLFILSIAGIMVAIAIKNLTMEDKENGN